MQKHPATDQETLFPLEPIEELDRNMPRKLSRLRQKLGRKGAERLQESRMRENRTSGLTGGRQSPCKT
jgi:hypothetical protein